MSPQENRRAATEAECLTMIEGMKAGRITPEEAWNRMLAMEPEDQEVTNELLLNLLREQVNRAIQPTPEDATYLGRFVQREALKPGATTLPDEAAYDAYRALRSFETIGIQGQVSFEEGDLMLIHPANTMHHKAKPGEGNYAQTGHSLRIAEALQEVEQNLRKLQIEHADRRAWHLSQQAKIAEPFLAAERRQAEEGKIARRTARMLELQCSVNHEAGFWHEPEPIALIALTREDEQRLLAVLEEATPLSYPEDQAEYGPAKGSPEWFETMEMLADRDWSKMSIGEITLMLQESKMMPEAIVSWQISDFPSFREAPHTPAELTSTELMEMAASILEGNRVKSEFSARINSLNYIRTWAQRELGREPAQQVPGQLEEQDDFPLDEDDLPI